MRAQIFIALTFIDFFKLKIILIDSHRSLSQISKLLGNSRMGIQREFAGNVGSVGMQYDKFRDNLLPSTS